MNIFHRILQKGINILTFMRTKSEIDTVLQLVQHVVAIDYIKQHVQQNQLLFSCLFL